MKMPMEMRWRLAQGRAERTYRTSPYAGLSCGPVKLGIADANIHACRKGVWVFQFGAYATTHVLAYGSLEDALEDAAAWLVARAPGHLTKPDYAFARYIHACRKGVWVFDLGLSLEGELSVEQMQLMQEAAEADLTYTESGWLLSHEWTCTEIHTPEELLAYVQRQ